MGHETRDTELPNAPVSQATGHSSRLVCWTAAAFTFTCLFFNVTNSAPSPGSCVGEGGGSCGVESGVPPIAIVLLWPLVAAWCGNLCPMIVLKSSRTGGLPQRPRKYPYPPPLCEGTTKGTANDGFTG